MVPYCEHRMALLQLNLVSIEALCEDEAVALFFFLFTKCREKIKFIWLPSSMQ